MSKTSVVIAGQHLPIRKHAVIALQSIYGIGATTSKKLCKDSRIPEDIKIGEITDAQEEALRHHVSQIKTEVALRTEVKMNIKMEMDTGSYRGRRHRYGLPVRGQRTKTNAKTSKRRNKRSSK